MEKENHVNLMQTILALAIILIGGYFLFGQQTDQKRIICSEYLDSAHTLVNEIYPSLASIPFDEYFYSKTLRTCVAGIVAEKNIPKENKVQTSYLVFDTINSKEIWGRLGTRYYEPQDGIEERLTQSDSEYHQEYLTELSKLR